MELIEHIIRDKYANRARLGAAWLDVWEPGWVDKVSVGRLDMGDRNDCVLGQLYGEFSNRHELLRGSGGEVCCVALGFMLGDPDCKLCEHLVEPGDSYAWLTEAWELVVADRRGASD